MAYKKKLRTGELLYLHDGGAVVNSGFRVAEIVLLSKSEVEKLKHDQNKSIVGDRNESKPKFHNDPE